MNNPFGLDDDDFNLIQTIFRTVPYSVYVFGSRAKGTQTPFSDLDLYIDGDLSDDMASDLTTILDESNVSIKVDIKSNVSEEFLALIKPDFVPLMLF
jgi:predicted nucleotidyltransferase